MKPTQSEKLATLGLGHFLQQAPRDPEAVGPQLNFTYAPKTFSRKFFMHFEGIEQLERRKEANAAQRNEGRAWRRRESGNDDTKAAGPKPHMQAVWDLVHSGTFALVSTLHVRQDRIP